MVEAVRGMLKFNGSVCKHSITTENVGSGRQEFLKDLVLSEF